METIKIILAVIAVVVIGFFFVKRIVSCLWRVVVTIVMLAVLYAALTYLGAI